MFKANKFKLSSSGPIRVMQVRYTNTISFINKSRPISSNTFFFFEGKRKYVKFKANKARFSSPYFRN